MVNAICVSIISIYDRVCHHFEPYRHSVVWQEAGHRTAGMRWYIHVGSKPRTEVRKSCIYEGSTGGAAGIVYFSMLWWKGVRHSKCMV